MKKLVLMEALGILLAASVTPAFAKGGPPVNPGQGNGKAVANGLHKDPASGSNQGQGQSHQTPPGQSGSDPSSTNQGKHNGQDNGNGKPSGSEDHPGKGPKDPSPAKSHKPEGGKNFVLSGTVVSIDGDNVTITVHSGNHLVQGLEGKQIVVDKSDAVIWAQSSDGNSPDDRDHKTPATLKAGDMVWVHGWWTAPQESSTSDTTSTENPGAYTARQIKILNQLPTDQEQPEG